MFTSVFYHSAHFHQPSLLCTSGTRLGISEHLDENYKVYGFHLTAEDNADIEAVLDRSNGRKIITTIGDCGAEYR